MRRLRTHPLAILKSTGRNEGEWRLQRYSGLVYPCGWVRLDVLSSGPPFLRGRVKSRGTAARTKKGWRRRDCAYHSLSIPGLTCTPSSTYIGTYMEVGERRVAGQKRRADSRVDVSVRGTKADLRDGNCTSADVCMYISVLTHTAINYTGLATTV